MQRSLNIFNNVRNAKEWQRPRWLSLVIKKAWKVVRNFFKTRRKQKFGIAHSMAIAILCMYGIYSMDYSVDGDNTASLEVAADKALHYYGFTSEFTESIKVGRMLFVQFRNIGDGGKTNKEFYSWSRILESTG